MSPPAEGWLLPELPALVRWLPGEGAEFVDVAGGRALRAAGRFGEELRVALEGGGEGPSLQALPADNPLRRALAGLEGRPAPRLAAPAALRLAGFGILFIELTHRCNQRCLHCYASASPQSQSELPVALGEDLLAQAAALGFERVQLTGGEPLLHRSVPALCRRAGELGLDCEIFTNGLLLEGELFEQLAGMRPSFAFSLYAARPELHDAITATPGSHARTVAAIRRAAARGLPTRVAVIAMAENAGVLGETMAFARSLGADQVRAGPSAAVGRGRLFTGQLDATMLCENDASAAPVPRGRLCVTPGGTVLPCIFNRAQVLGSLGERSLAEIVARPDASGARGPSGSTSMQLAALRGHLPCLDCQLTALALRCLQEGRA